MKVELVSYTPNPVQSIESAASNCYDCPYDKCNWCDKVGGKHLAYGYCSDVYDLYESSSTQKVKGAHYNLVRTRDKRRYNTHIKNKRFKDMLASTNRWCYPYRGYYKEKYNAAMQQWEAKSYISYPQNSNQQQFLKRQSNKRVRRDKNIPNYGGYKKCFEYWWSLD